MDLPSFPNVDLFSAGIDALNGVHVAGDPSHDRDYSLTGLLIMAFFGGIRAGVSRDILLNHIPSPLKDPKYIFACILMGLPGLANYRHAESREEHFRKRALAFKSFTLPWYAILGAHKSLDHGAGIYTAITIGLISTTAGGVFIDLCSEVTPEVLRPCEHVLTTAALATTTYVLLAKYELRTAPAIPVRLMAVLIAFAFRVVPVTGTLGTDFSLQSAQSGSGSACGVMLIEYSEDLCHRW